MSIYLGGNISDIYIGNDRVDAVYINDELIYSYNNYIYEMDIPFYFQTVNSTTVAQVGFQETTTSHHPSGSVNPPSVDDSKFTGYITPIFEYSFDKKHWNQYVLGTPISIGNGQVSNIVYFRGNNYDATSRWWSYYSARETVESTTYTHYFNKWVHAFINNNQVYSGGNIMSLRYKNNFAIQKYIPTNYAFSLLFYNCSLLVKAPLLPATSLKLGSYGIYYSTVFYDENDNLLSSAGMFYGCTSLIEAPELPATTLTDYCYNGMFCKCTSLISAPNIFATKLATYCCAYMFDGCSSLINAPILYTTTLTNYCYIGMFRNCISLINAPQLPATTLATYCYANMFYGCASLTNAPVLSATTLATYCYSNMFNHCTALANPPILPATTLANGCYSYMFYNCTSLVTIPKIIATNIPDYSCQYMFNGDSVGVYANTTQTSLCRYTYRIPSTGDGTAGSTKAFELMFYSRDTGSSITPDINTTFYVSVPSIPN